ncbi:hypothetical protein Fmac_003398 [Flemingia macrophylla]|uniref:Pentatricopeptide repeat-containing protein n=1 Tax=Flemingia macrophylla TaxID=520843 RepID=A0ABD1NPI6_9FABA
MYEQAEGLFEDLRSNDYKLERAFYHLMMKMYRTFGDHLKAENLLAMMTEFGIEPSLSTMHLLMVSCSQSGQPEEAKNVFKNLRTRGVVALDTLPYSSVLDAYLKKGDFNARIQKLAEIKEAGIEPDYRIWTCFVRAASLSEGANEAIILLNALQGAGFDLTIRVADKDWGADFRKLSAGSALVGLTLWLDHMQDASLQGYPKSPKSVVLVTGTAEYNMVSLDSTLKACLWKMGSPFLPCKTRQGVLVAKAHSLRLWLKDSPFCLDLELKDAPNLPELNSMQLIEGAL